MTSVKMTDSISDVQVSFTQHALQRLQERFGAALDILGKLLHNSFSFESFSAGGKTNWRMIIPLRFCLIGAFEQDWFVVKTVFFNISQTQAKRVSGVKRLRIINISVPPLEWRSPEMKVQ
ncbi:MAG: hypothetical protein WED05_12140 [Candidatus Atabeyarchaeum deiterrae]